MRSNDQSFDEYVAERKKFFGLTTETKDIPKSDKSQLEMISSTLSMFGGSLADTFKVEKYQGPAMQKADEYTAIRPGQTHTNS